MDRRRIGIVIPALNEVGSIGPVITASLRYGIAIVVDDGSHDGTGSEAVRAGANVVRNDVRKGYDGALNAGFERAASLGCQYVVTVDADGQHDPTLLGTFLRELDNGADVVVGVRDRRQRLGERLFAWIAAARWGIRDPLCGMKAYRIEIWKELGHFDCYGSVGTELALFAHRSGKRLTQVPVRTRDRSDAPRFGRIVRSNYVILRSLAIGIRSRGNCAAAPDHCSHPPISGIV